MDFIGTLDGLYMNFVESMRTLCGLCGVHGESMETCGGL